MPNKTNIFEYLDAIAFLKDFYRDRKQLQPAFSYDQWADEIGFKSRSLLRMILSRKRKITDGMIDLLCRHLFQNEIQRDYFCSLVIFTQSKSALERKYAGQRLTQMLKRHVDVSKIKPVENLLSTPLTVRLFSVLDEDSLDRTLPGLSKFFDAPASQIAESLDFLIRENLATNENGFYSVKRSAFRIDDDFGNEVLENYHAQLLGDAVAAHRKDVSLRRFQSAVALLTNEQFVDLLSQADQLVQGMVSAGRAGPVEPRRLYQMNFNAHAVSGTLELISG